MIKELLHPIAVDFNGKSIHISQAEKGKQYFCPYCTNKFVFNRSLKTGKGSRRAHFSHENLSPNCTPEGYLHSTFKILLIEYLNKNKDTNIPFIISYKCNLCMNTHSSDLLKGAITVKGEYDLDVCRPDIALLVNGECVYAVIEVIVTHEPDEKAINYYRDNQIVVIKIILNSDDDLLNYEEKLKFPSEVIINDQRQCPVMVERQRQIYMKNMGFQRQNISPVHSGPRIDQIEAQKTANDRKRYFAIKNYYKKKKR